ncbi:hypothetical protein JW848_00925, partial [Candidatus Bipolaricaulota bacterium]|nr:hypothetical protein [Candidatus Bipolaricaulota bacterium]
LAPNVSLSFKNTDGDFKLPNAMDTRHIGAAEPSRQIVEFDAWREFEGNNYFPCYMGNIWVPRLRALKEKGVGRIAVRLMWNSKQNPLFERPWGNAVNLFTLLEFGRNPAADADTILGTFVEKNFPAADHAAATALYKYSPEYQRALYYVGDKHVGNHSKLHGSLKDVQSIYDELAADGHFTKATDFEARRSDLRTAYRKAVTLLNALKATPKDWQEALKKGALIEYLASTGITDQLEFAYWSTRGGMKDPTAFLAGAKRNATAWQTLDAASFDHLQGDEVLKLFVPKEETKEEKKD